MRYIAIVTKRDGLEVLHEAFEDADEARKVCIRHIQSANDPAKLDARLIHPDGAIEHWAG